jgi:O-antigen ligase
LISLMFIAVKVAIITTVISFVTLAIRMQIDLHKKIVLSIIIFAVLISVSFRIPSMLNRFNEIRVWASGQTTTDNTISQRLVILNCSLQLFSDNLWTGTGSRNFQKGLNEHYASEGNFLLKDRNYNPHNQFLSEGINYGIFMLLVFVVCLLIIFRNMVHKEEGIYFTIAILLFFLSESLLERQMGVYFFGLIGLLFYNIDDSKDEEVTS